MSTLRKKLAADRPEMPPKTLFVGDRIKVKKDRGFAIKTACEACGWNVNVEAIRTVTRDDHFGASGRRRLFVDGPPHCFDSADVELAWNSPEERRKALIELGSWAPTGTTKRKAA